MPELGKRPIPAVTAVIGAELVFPGAERTSSMEGHQASTSWLFRHPTARGWPPNRCSSGKWPRVLEYSRQLREELLSRALYRKHHQEAGRPFYSQFNIAPETFSPFKVVWKRISNDFFPLL